MKHRYKIITNGKKFRIKYTLASRSSTIKDKNGDYLEFDTKSDAMNWIDKKTERWYEV